jgi:hypothetical protein
MDDAKLWHSKIFHFTEDGAALNNESDVFKTQTVSLVRCEI